MKPTIKTMEQDLKVLFRKWESKIHFFNKNTSNF